MRLGLWHWTYAKVGLLKIAHNYRSLRSLELIDCNRFTHVTRSHAFVNAPKSSHITRDFLNWFQINECIKFKYKLVYCQSTSSLHSHNYQSSTNFISVQLLTIRSLSLIILQFPCYKSQASYFPSICVNQFVSGIRNCIYRYLLHISTSSLAEVTRSVHKTNTRTSVTEYWHLFSKQQLLTCTNNNNSSQFLLVDNVIQDGRLSTKRSQLVKVVTQQHLQLHTGWPKTEYLLHSNFNNSLTAALNSI